MSDVAIQRARPGLPGSAMRLLGDERLARLAATGSRDAFAAIYARHHQGIYRYCRSILASSEDAADALQSTMASALVALEGERREIVLKPWLYRIAHNEAVSLLRRRRPQEQAEELETAAGPTLERTAEDRERLRQLVADLSDLSERQRGALLMRELSGLSYAEVAAVLGLSVGAAKQTVFEGRAALQELAEGRAMLCEAIRRSISDRDRRALRGRRVRAHMRDCSGCRDFRELIDARQKDLQGLAPPLPAAAAGAILEALFGGGGPAGGLPHGGAAAEALAAGGASASTAGGLAWLPGAGALGASAAGKGLVVVAAAVALGGGAVEVASRAAGGGDRPAARAPVKLQDAQSGRLQPRRGNGPRADAPRQTRDRAPGTATGGASKPARAGDGVRTGYGSQSSPATSWGSPRPAEPARAPGADWRPGDGSTTSPYAGPGAGAAPTRGPGDRPSGTEPYPGVGTAPEQAPVSTSQSPVAPVTTSTPDTSSPAPDAFGGAPPGTTPTASGTIPTAAAPTAGATIPTIPGQ